MDSYRLPQAEYLPCIGPGCGRLTDYRLLISATRRLCRLGRHTAHPDKAMFVFSRCIKADRKPNEGVTVNIESWHATGDQPASCMAPSLCHLLALSLTTGVSRQAFVSSIASTPPHPAHHGTCAAIGSHGCRATGTRKPCSKRVCRCSLGQRWTG